MESYVDCISDCPITTDSLIWVDNVPVHIDDEYVFVNLNSNFLDNLIAIQFEIEYDENVLELDVNNCSGDYNADCEISNTSLSYLTNTSNPGIIQGIIYSGMFFSIDNQFLNIKFKILGDLGDYSNISINQFEINDINIINYVQDGLVTIGNFGCMDDSACNFSPEATFESESCDYVIDCSDECGGNAVLDQNGECCSLENADCIGICGGSALLDECDVCDGEMFIDQYGFYPDGACDCDGTLPYTYCIDNDGDLLGNPESEFFSCSEIIQEALVSECTDIDDDCLGVLDDCDICNGDNSAKDCAGECFGNAMEDCTGECEGSALEDECGECNGNGIDEGTCDCEGTLPIEYCIDNDNDGISDSTPISLCSASLLGELLIECQLLNIDDDGFIGNFNLLSAYPNPFNPAIEISYFIQSSDWVTISILDVNGNQIKSLASRFHISGEHFINWEPGNNVSSGLYIIQIKSSDRNLTKKINYIK